MGDLAWINGEISAIDEARVSFLDHGYFFGYGVYEVFKIYRGIPFAVEEHLDRLENSMKEIRIVPDFTREKLKKYISDLIDQSGLSDAVFYLQVTRGTGPRNHGILKNPKPCLTMFVSGLPPFPEEKRKKGIKAIILKDERWAKPYIKTLNLLPNSLARQTAEEQGAQEAILERENGYISEAASSNVFTVFGDTIVTSPTDGKILAGISRSIVLRIVAKHHLQFREDYFTAEELRKADEVFITNTGSEVLAVTCLDGKPVGNGEPGPITEQLYSLFMEEVHQYIEENKGRQDR